MIIYNPDLKFIGGSMNIEMLLKSSFRGGEAARAIGVKSGTLARWVDRGLARPSNPTTGGSGTRNEYSFDDIVRVGFMKALASQGHSWARASLLAFQSAKESEYGQALSKAITDSIAAWIQYDAGVRYSKGEGSSTILTSVPPPEPAPVYFVFFHDETGRLASIYVPDAEHFAGLYTHFKDVEAPVMVNLTAIIHKAVSALEGR